MSKLLVDALRHTSASSDAVTLDSSGNLTVEGNLTVDGTSTLTGTVTGDNGAWVKLSQVTNGGTVNDIIFDSLDTSTYRAFKFIGGMVPENDNQEYKYWCDWYGKEYYGDSSSEICSDIINDYGLDKQPKIQTRRDK